MAHDAVCFKNDVMTGAVDRRLRDFQRGTVVQPGVLQEFADEKMFQQAFAID